jgi:hypothetical protein
VLDDPRLVAESVDDAAHRLAGCIGIDREAEVLDAGLAMLRITKAGSWFAYGEQRIGQGRSAGCASTSRSVRAQGWSLDLRLRQRNFPVGYPPSRPLGVVKTRGQIPEPHANRPASGKARVRISGTTPRLAAALSCEPYYIGQPVFLDQALLCVTIT